MNISPGIISPPPSFRGASKTRTRNLENKLPLDSGFVASRRPGMTTSSDRLVHGDELGAVRKRRLDLDVVDHFGNPVHALSASQDLGAGLHQLGHGAAVARALDDEIGNDRDR